MKQKNNDKTKRIIHWKYVWVALGLATLIITGFVAKSLWTADGQDQIVSLNKDEAKKRMAILLRENTILLPLQQMSYRMIARFRKAIPQLSKLLPHHRLSKPPKKLLSLCQRSRLRILDRRIQKLLSLL